jgi:N-acetylglucosaminyldiphosphoundecaprenol N-acetyl-beta-D-mannosaminyltransferase
MKKALLNFEINNIPLHSIEKIGLSFLLNSLVKNNSPQQIITLNTDFLRIATQNKEFYDLCRRTDINFIDGTPVKWLIHLKYNKTAERITGNDLFEESLKYANLSALKIALVGSSEEILEKVKNKIQYSHPQISLVTLSPGFMFETNEKENSDIISKLKSFSPDFLFVAMGCPRQEMWINKFKDEIGSKINVGIGSTFEYYSGVTKRSPVFMQNLGLEWFWRFVHHPKRYFKRYFYYDLPFFVKLFFLEMRKKIDVRILLE